PRVHVGRAARDARRGTVAAAKLRAVPRAGRADPDAAPRSAARAGRRVIVRERPASGEAAGALVLFHGRGADENDLFPLLDALDPERRFVGATPRGPLSLPPGGAHWYALGGIGTPEATSFHASYAAATEWLDGFLAEHHVGYERLVLGGFS